MATELLSLLNPFLTAGIATFALFYYFVRPKHKLSNQQILLFWFLVGAVFFFIPYIPKALSIPFAYFIVQAVVVYLLLRNYWRVKGKDALKYTVVFVVLNASVILVFGYLLKGIV